MNKQRTNAHTLTTVIVEAWQDQADLGQPHSDASPTTKMLTIFRAANLTLPEANIFGHTLSDYTNQQQASQTAGSQKRNFVLPKRLHSQQLRVA